jgi:hypothetical protein
MTHAPSREKTKKNQLCSVPCANIIPTRWWNNDDVVAFVVPSPPSPAQHPCSTYFQNVCSQKQIIYLFLQEKEKRSGLFRMEAYCVRVADCNNIYIWQRLLNHSAESHNFISSISLKRNYDWVSRTPRGRLEPDAERWPSRSFVLTRWWWCRQQWRLKRPFNSREWSTTRRWWRPVIEWSLGEFRHMGSKVRGNERRWKGGFGLLLVVSLWRCLETRKYPSNAQERKVVLWDRQWKNERLSTVFFCAH